MVATNTFIQDIVLFIRDLLRDNVTDPISRTSGVGFVMTAFPKREQQYPMIVARHTGLNTKKLGMSSELQWTIVTLEIKVFSRNAKECDDLTQKVVNTLRTNEYGTGSTTINNVFGFQITSIVPIVEVTGDNTIHQKVITVNYKFILGN